MTVSGNELEAGCALSTSLQPRSIRLVHPVDVPAMHDEVEALLHRAFARGGYSANAVMAEVMQLQSFLWVVGDFDAVVIGKVINRPTERVFWIDWVGGSNPEEWAQEWEEVQSKFCRQAECTAVECKGRLGWKKHHKGIAADYKPVATVYRKEIYNGRHH